MRLKHLSKSAPLAALVLTLTTGLMAPHALAASDPEGTDAPSMERPAPGMQGERPAGRPQFQRGRRGGPGPNGEQPPERPRWGGTNGERPGPRPSGEPGMAPPSGGDGSFGDRPHRHGPRPNGPRTGRPGSNGASETEAPAS